MSELAPADLLSWICGTLAHAVGGHWVRRWPDAVYICLCGTTETNHAVGFYRRSTA